MKKTEPLDDYTLGDKLHAAFNDAYDGENEGSAWRAVVRAALAELADLDAFAEPLRDAYSASLIPYIGESMDTWSEVARAARETLSI